VSRASCSDLQVWAAAVVLLCQFHVLQAVQQRMQDGKDAFIPKEDRAAAMTDVKALMYSRGTAGGQDPRDVLAEKIEVRSSSTPAQPFCV
jgi:hypothetical protein